MKDLKKTIEDIRIAVETDRMLDEKTSYFKHKSVLVDSIIEWLMPISMEDMMDIAMEFPELKEKLLREYRKEQRSQAENDRAWAKADMTNRSNW